MTSRSMDQMLTDGCLRGDLRYAAPAQPQFQSQCCYRECQYISGGHPNIIIGLSAKEFCYAAG